MNNLWALSLACYIDVMSESMPRDCPDARWECHTNKVKTAETQQGLRIRVDLDTVAGHYGLRDVIEILPKIRLEWC